MCFYSAVAGKSIIIIMVLGQTSKPVLIGLCLSMLLTAACEAAFWHGPEPLLIALTVGNGVLVVLSLVILAAVLLKIAPIAIASYYGIFMIGNYFTVYSIVLIGYLIKHLVDSRDMTRDVSWLLFKSLISTFFLGVLDVFLIEFVMYVLFVYLKVVQNRRQPYWMTVVVLGRCCGQPEPE